MAFPTQKALRACLIGIVVGVASVSHGITLDQSHEATGASRIFLVRQGEDRILTDFATGLPADPPSLTESTASCGAILGWEVRRESWDRLGFRHVIYQQYLRPRPGSLPPTIPTDTRIPLRGGEIGLHYDSEGLLSSVFGAQFNDVVSVGALNLANVSDARSVARMLVENVVGVTLLPDEFLSGDLAALLREQTVLSLASEGAGRVFSFVWMMPFVTTYGRDLRVAMNAQEQTLLAAWDSTATYVCEPSSFENVTAIGHPQNGEVDLRSMEATATADRPGYTHEGHRAATPAIPGIQVFQGSYTICSQGGMLGQLGLVRGELLPLQSQQGVPHYEDLQGPSVPGKSGGDALWKTYQTMLTYDWLGFDSFDNAGTTARITVQAWGGDTNGAGFVNGTGDVRGWQNGVIVFDRASDENDPNFDENIDFEYSACLDVIAHEWGHGTICARTDWTRGTQSGWNLHEGWADVIGHIVEWHMEPEGSGPEKADWMGAEDRAEGGDYPERRVDVDDHEPVGDCPPCVGWLSFHRDDPTGALDDPEELLHGIFEGNRAPVALRLNAVGGQNPVCERFNDGLEGCALDVNGLGMEMASQIFFRTLTVYSTQNVSWLDFADLSKQAAFDLFAYYRPGGWYNAVEEQRSVADAFAAVGYPGGPALICYLPPWPSCEVLEPPER